MLGSRGWVPCQESSCHVERLMMVRFLCWVLSGLETEVGSQGVMGAKGSKRPPKMDIIRALW